MKEVLTLQFDGGSRGNPGPAGIGIVISSADGVPLVTLGRFIGRATNNVAEYKALITALEEAKRLGAKKIAIRGDSELIIKQMKGEYRVKHPDMKDLYDEAQFLIQRQHKVGNKWSAAVTAGTTAKNIVTFTNSPGAGTWRYRVRAKSVAGTSAFTPWKTVTLP